MALRYHPDGSSAFGYLLVINDVVSANWDTNVVVGNGDQWEMIAFVHNQSAVNNGLYINGTAKWRDTKNYWWDALDNPDELWIGARSNQYFTNGLMDEVGIWDRALTSAELQSIYANVTLGCYDYDLYINNSCTFNLTNRSGVSDHIPILKVEFRNATDGSLVNVTINAFINYSWELNDEYKELTLSMDNKSFYLYKYPEDQVITANVQIDYSTNDATFSYFNSNMSFDQTQQNLTLYVSDDTTTVTFTVFDENDDRISDVYITVKEWDVGSGSYYTTQILKTDTNGEALGEIVLDDAWYVFELIYLGETVLTTEKTKITSTSKNFWITLGVVSEDISHQIMLWIYH